MTLKHIFLVVLFSFVSLIGSYCNETTAGDKNSSTGKVVKIIDGDTYDILIAGVQTRIRMYGIDAPERGQDYYKVSKEYLGQLCEGKTIRIAVINKDRYGRTIAQSYLSDGRELGAEMIKAGMAWHFKKYSTDTNLASFEIHARNAKMGVWTVSHPIAPWDYRKMKKRKN